MTRSSVGRTSTPSRLESFTRPSRSGLLTSGELGALLIGHGHHSSLGRYSHGEAYTPYVSGALTMLALKWYRDPAAGPDTVSMRRRGRRGMGIIVQFPEGQRLLGGGRYVDANSEPASVIILPVV